MTCAHGFIGACAECDGSGQTPSDMPNEAELEGALLDAARADLKARQANAHSRIEASLRTVAGKGAEARRGWLEGSMRDPVNHGPKCPQRILGTTEPCDCGQAERSDAFEAEDTRSFHEMAGDESAALDRIADAVRGLIPTTWDDHSKDCRDCAHDRALLEIRRIIAATGREV